MKSEHMRSVQHTEQYPEDKEKMKQKIESAQPSVEWVTYVPDKQYGVIVSLPYNCRISATLDYREDDRVILYIDMFTVNERIQKNGIGTRLLKALANEAKQYGTTELYGNITSLPALKTRANVFGSEHLEFYNHVTKEKMDMSFEDALLYADAHEGKVNYDVRVDLTQVPTRDWETPVRKDT